MYSRPKNNYRKYRSYKYHKDSRRTNHPPADKTSSKDEVENGVPENRAPRRNYVKRPPYQRRSRPYNKPSTSTTDNKAAANTEVSQ